MRIRRVEDQKQKSVKKSDPRKPAYKKPVQKLAQRTDARKAVPSKKTTTPLKKPSPAQAAPTRAVPPVPDAVSIERTALSGVNKTLAEIEGFLAKWESSRVKPPHMKAEVEKIKKLHVALTSWQTNSLKASRGSPDAAASEKRVKALTLILEK